jgi:phage shock protein A
MKKEEVTNTEILAVLNKSFSRIEERFEAIDKRFEVVDKRFENVEDQLQKVRKDIMVITDKFPSMYQFDELSDRVAKLEAKAGKTKKIKA